MNTMILILTAVFAFVWSAAGIVVHRQPSFRCKVGQELRSGHRSTGWWRGSWTMYFDDVSNRYTYPWKPSQALPQRRSPFTNMTYSEQKQAALKRFVIGFDSNSARHMSEKEIEKEMSLWILRTGLIGDDFVPGEYDEIERFDIIRPANSLVSVFLYIWKAVVSMIKESDLAYDGADVDESKKISLLVFPGCSVLDKYETFATLKTATTLCEDLCQFLGKRINVKLFHPNYMQTPVLFDPARHSPFPCVGLEIQELPEAEVLTKLDSMLEQELNPLLSEQRQVLEKLYGMGAVFDTLDNTKRNTPEKSGPQSLSGENTQRSDGEQRTESGTDAIYQTHPYEVIVDEMKEWIEKTNLLNPTNTTWWISDSSLGEEAYLSVWSAIRTLEAHHFWHAQSPSAMIVLPHFHVFNGPSFRRFAITVNGILKRFTRGMYSVEVFHPEYVGSKKDEGLRRSPFPALQVVPNRWT